MSDDAVTTILEIDATGATAGEAEYSRAMDGAAAASAKLTEQIGSLNDNLKLAGLNQAGQQIAGLNDSMSAASDGFHMTGLEVATTANHIRQAAEAAYLLSPAFRELVNPAIAVGIRATGSALGALGPVVGGVAADIASRMLPALALVGRIAIPITIAKEAISAMSAIAELGAQKIKEFDELANNAGGAGVSTDFFQRESQAAKDLGLNIDAATASLKKFNDSSTPTLAGSTVQNKINELTKNGNFANNPGVAEYSHAATTEDRYRAVVDLITNAMDKGERLAALDLAKTFASPELLAQLRADGDILKEMQVAADAIKPVDIVSAEQIGYALQLKTRLDDANSTITNGLKPVQKDLTQLGLNYQESWVGITELEASAVTGANNLYSALKGIPGLFAEAGSSPFWTKLTEFTGRLGLNSTPESMGLTLPGQPGYTNSTASGSPANAALAAGLNNPMAVRDAMLQANDTQYAVRKDLSKPPPDPKSDQNDHVDSAYNTLEKHTEQQIADTQAIGLGDAALAAFKAEAAETSAVLANGGKETDAQVDKFSDLKDAAEAAAGALAKAKVASTIDVGRQTAFLSSEDVSIASQLKGIYGNDVPAALASTEAAAIRVNSAFKTVSSSIESGLTTGLTDIVSGTKSVSQGFTEMGNSILKAIEQMIIKLTIVQPLMSALQGTMTGNGGILSMLGMGVNPIAAGGTVPGAIGPTSVGGAALVGLHGGGIVGSEATFSRYVHPAHFNDAPRFHTGGIAGDEVPIIARKGEGVFTPGQMAALGGGGGGGGPPNMTVNVHNNTGTAADASATVGPNGSIEVTLNKAIDAAVGKSLSSGTGMRVLNGQYGVRPFMGQ